MELWIFIALEGLFLTAAAVEDWRTNSVSGELCLVLGCVSGVTLYRLVAYPITVAVFVVLVMFYFFPTDLIVFGDADLLPIGMYLSVYLSRSVPFNWMLIYPVFLLIILIPYAKVYAKAHNTEWHWGKGQMIPMLPAFAIAWWLSGIACVILTIMH